MSTADSNVLRPSSRLIPSLTGLTAGTLIAMLGAVFSPLMAFAALIGLAAAAFIIALPFEGFLVTVFVIPLERLGRLSNDSSAYTFSIMRILGLLNLAALLVHVLLRRGLIRITLPLLFYTAYICVGISTLIFTEDTIGGIRTAGALAGNALFLFVIVNVVKTREHVKRALVCWLIITSCVGIFTIVRWHEGAAVTDSRFNSTGERDTDERFAVVLNDHAEFDVGEKIPRALGTTSHPAVYAINNIMALPFFALFYHLERRWWLKGATVIGAAMTTYNVVLTNTRAAVVTVGVLLLLCVWTRLVRVTAPQILTVTLLGALCIPFLPEAMYNRILDLTNYSTAKSATLKARFLYWNAAIDIFADNPVFGIGMGNQREIPRRITEIRLPPNSSVHNEYLNSLIEVGLAGYVFLVGFFVLSYRYLRRSEKWFRSTGDRQAEMTLTASRIMYLVVLFYAIQVDCFHFPLKGWWLVMGLVIVLHDVALAEMRQMQSAPDQKLS